jgi:endonuclease-3
LLVATILSAQCTDERVNKTTPELFRRFPDPASMAAADQMELEKTIRSTGFFRNKAKNLIGASRTIAEKFGGNVPDSMEQLLELSGVARKTANVVLGTWFGIADGVVVDTHVSRLSRRLGFTGHTDPKKIEKDLMQQVPREDWIALSHQLILHGRKTCKAQKPRCEQCFLADLCCYRAEHG